MEQKFTAYFTKKSPSARLDLRIIFNNYDEMSDSVREDFSDGEAENEIEKITLFHTKHCFFDYLHLFGDLLSCENTFEYFEKLFVATSETNNLFFKYQLRNAEKDYREYFEYGNFTKDFFDIFTNSKRITFNRQLLEVINGRFQPLRIDSKTDDIYYSYESTDIKDIIFASIHFALENGCKFVKCPHCERWFFKSSSRQDSNTKYCKRKSLVSGYSHLNCEQAVRNIKQQFTRIKNRIETKAQLSEKNCVCNYVWRFQNECSKFQDIIKESPTVENITKYMEFLQTTEKEREWLKNGNNK